MQSGLKEQEEISTSTTTLGLNPRSPTRSNCIETTIVEPCSNTAAPAQPDHPPSRLQPGPSALVRDSIFEFGRPPVDEPNPQSDINSSIRPLSPARFARSLSGSVVSRGRASRNQPATSTHPLSRLPLSFLCSLLPPTLDSGGYIPCPLVSCISFGFRSSLL